MSLNYKTIVEENDELFKFVENEKRKLLKKAYSIKLTIFSIITLYTVIDIFPSIIKDSSLLAGIIVCSTIIVFSALILLWANNESLLSSKVKRSFYGTYKLKLMGNIIKLISEELGYKPQNRILNKIIVDSGLFKGKITDFKGRNLIYGSFNETEIQMSELRLMKGLTCVFEGFFVFVSKIDKDAIDFKTINSLNGKWNVQNDNLYIAFKGVKKLFEIRIEKSNRSIEKTKLQTSFLLNVLAIASKSANVQFHSNYQLTDLKEIDLESLDTIKTSKNLHISETYTLSTSSKRIQNLLLDQLSIIVILFVVLSLVMIFSGSLKQNNYIFIALYVLVYFMYYIVFETLYSRTIGKFITRTKVITNSGDKPNLKVIIKRTFCRLIPFDSYSFIDNEIGFQDKYSKTLVVIDKKMNNNC
ncbi:MAG: RDD family protein [Bacteroidales bacterium]|nr:RDD family protein [Bacteroidales bacterium]